MILHLTEKLVMYQKNLVMYQKKSVIYLAKFAMSQTKFVWKLFQKDQKITMNSFFHIPGVWHADLRV